MAANDAVKVPSNKEVAFGMEWALFEDYKVENATDMYNGRWVRIGSSQGQIIVCSDESTSPVGVLVRDRSNANVEVSDRGTTTYTLGDWACVVSGPGVIVVCYTAETSMDKGTMVVCADNGGVKAYSTDTHIPRVGICWKEVEAAGDILVKLTR